MLSKFLVAIPVLAGLTAALSDIPPLGFGTWRSERDKVAHAVEYALKTGYRHIDAASIYRNEDETGRGIAAAGIPREQLWVTSKLWNSDHRPAEARAALEKTLADLGLDYLDLYLIHWPVAFVPRAGTALDRRTSLLDTWRALESFVEANLTRYIGVSNFARADVETILEHAKIRPYAHEFEAHPYLQQQDFVDFHEEEGIKAIAYSPLANTNPTYHSDIGPIFDDPFWKDVAARKNVSVAQVVLAWGLARNTVVIPKSVKEGHIDDNIGALGIMFTEEELKEIALRDKKARFSDPSSSWKVKLFEDLDDPGRYDEDGNEVGDL